MDTNIEKELKKKKDEMQSIIYEEQKHIKTELEKTIKQTLTENNKEKFKKLEGMIKKEELLLKHNLHSLVDNAPNISVDSSIMIFDVKKWDTFKSDLYHQIDSSEKRILREQKNRLEKTTIQIKEDFSNRCAALEASFKKDLEVSLKPVTSELKKYLTSLQKTNSYIEKEPPKPINSLEPSPSLNATLNKETPKNPSLQHSNDSPEKSSSIDESVNKKSISLKEIYAQSRKKVPFMLNEGTGIIGTCNLQKKWGKGLHSDKKEQKNSLNNLFFFGKGLQKRKF